MWKQPMSIYAANLVKKALKPLLRAEVQKMDLIYIENLKKETKTDTI